MPKISLKPNKLVLCNEFGIASDTPDYVKQKSISCSKNKPVREYHNFILSKKSQIAMKEKINWLYLLSRARYKKTLSNKNIYNFKLSFITLTLPSEQIHPTSVITKECFNQFLTEIRSQYKVENYVWRLEFQSNGNVHYHIVTDSYIDYYIVRKVWNRIINKLGYVDRFSNVMKSLSFNEYYQTRYLNNSHVCKRYGNNKNVIFQKAFDNYTKGVREGWKVPNSVSTDNVTSKSNIAWYVSKYFSKKGQKQNPCNPLDNEENSFGLRLWYCSQSLSKLKNIVSYEGEVYFDLWTLLSEGQKVWKKFYRYCSIVWFDFKNLPDYICSILRNIFYEEANRIGYVYPT